MEKHVKHSNEAKYLGWKLSDNPAVAQVWIRSADLEVIDLITMDDPTVTTIYNKPELSNTKVSQTANADGTDISGDCNLHAEQLQMYSHDMKTKDEASSKTNGDVSQTIDTKVGNDIKGKPLEISVEGFNVGSIKLIFLAEGNT